MSSFWLYSGPGKPSLGGNPGRAKQLGFTNLGVLLELVLHSGGFSISFYLSSQGEPVVPGPQRAHVLPSQSGP